MNSIISFKLINEKNYDSISFHSETISLKDLKYKILVRLGHKVVTGPLKGKDRYRNIDDVLIYDESRKLITDESTLIPSDRRFLVERISIPRNLVGRGYPYQTIQKTSDNNAKKSPQKESFIGLLASELLKEECTTRAPTDDEMSQSEHEGAMKFIEERPNLLDDLELPEPVYFTDDFNELPQKVEEQPPSTENESKMKTEEPMIISLGRSYLTYPQFPETRPPFVKPPPPSTPYPQNTQTKPAPPQKYVPNDESKSSRMKEKRDRGVKNWEMKNWSRDGRSKKEQERDRERSRDNSRTRMYYKNRV